jgi:lipopolysaccharide assembly protein B
MDTIIIVFLLAVIALIIMFMYYDRYKKDRKGKDPKAYIEGLRALLDGHDEKAFGCFRDVVAEDSNNIDAYLRIGGILRKYGKPDKALQVHRDLTLRHGISIADKKSILLAIAGDYKDLEDYKSATKALNELLALDSNDRKAYEQLLDILVKTEQWDDAFATKEKLIKLGRQHSKRDLAIYKYYQGQALFEKKSFHKARLLLKEAIGMDEACTPAYVTLGDSYIMENRLEDAVAAWRNMVRVVPDESYRVMGRLKKALFDLGRFGDISAVCDEILDVSPSNLYARLALADYHMKKGENSTAAEYLRKAVDNHPDSSLPLLELARLYLATGDQEKLSDLMEIIKKRRDIAEHALNDKNAVSDTGASPGVFSSQ